MAKAFVGRYTGSGVSGFIGAVKDEWALYSDSPADYVVGLPIGFGASSTVYLASYKPSNDPASGSIDCALKVVDLDALPLKSLQLLKRETQLMSLSKHPNVLRVRGTWMAGHKLFIAMRLMKSGSVADVMRYGYPGGLEEEVCRCVLKQALEGLNYLHINGFIHRDLKAANLLIDEDGTVLLGDLGVAVALSDEENPVIFTDNDPGQSDQDVTGNRPIKPGARSALQLGKRRSFVGTPCWMAPEVVSQKQYDVKADIWSFGITALELTQGRAPHSREPPHKVLLKTLQDEPPQLDREGGPFKYSKSFSDMIEGCLAKDPSKRPSSQQLLQTPFFRNTKKKSYLVSTILKGLPPLTERLERRRQPTGPGPDTLEPWDFGSTVIGTRPDSPARRVKVTGLTPPSSPPPDIVEVVPVSPDVLVPPSPSTTAYPVVEHKSRGRSRIGTERKARSENASSQVPSPKRKKSMRILGERIGHALERTISGGR